MKTFQSLLIKLNACQDAKEWSINYTIEDVLKHSYRGDWILWLAQRLNTPLNKLTLAKARCAKTVIHLMKDQRSINAVNVAERFGLDKCTLKELHAAAAAADAADSDAADAYATANTAYAAAANTTYAYTAAAVDAAYVAAVDAAVAAAAAAVAADAAAVAAVIAAVASVDDNDNVKKKNQQQISNICVEILGVYLIEAVNKYINE